MTVVPKSSAICERVSPLFTTYCIVDEDEVPFEGTISVLPAYIKFGFDILFKLTRFATVVLYCSAILVNVAP